MKVYDRRRMPYHAKDFAKNDWFAVQALKNDYIMKSYDQFLNQEFLIICYEYMPYSLKDVIDNPDE